MYQIVSIAIHSETREEMVVYQALYGDYKVYVRPLDMFMSEVDRAKYPDVKQKYRFERVDANGVSLEVDYSNDQTHEDNAVRSSVSDHFDTIKSQIREESTHGSLEQEREKFRNAPYKPSEIMEKSVDEEAQELNLDPLVIEFMDADLAADKNDILSKLRPIITNDMIDIMAMSLGVVVNEGDVYDRFNDLRTCLTTMEKFESSRLRS
ncbi:MAG: DUF1653 domain-containing protein [Butyrivibrio sp.]|nr:DUF1653 domain-containing protein [Butyrivibrio sp.]